MNTSRRKRALFGALAVTLALSVATTGRGKIASAPVTSAPRAGFEVSRPSGVASHTAEPPPRVELERLVRRQDVAACEAPDGYAFRPMSWYVPPPPPPPQAAPAPTPAPPPSAPTVPFSFMGLYEEYGKRIILLVKGDQIYTVSEGEVIDNAYRLDRVSQGQLELTYLPLNIKQTISTGGT